MDSKGGRRGATERDWARHKQKERGSINKCWNIGQRLVAAVPLSSGKTKAIFIWMSVCMCVQSCKRINSVHSVLSCRNQLNIKNEDINEGISACLAQSICSYQSLCLKILHNMGKIRTRVRSLGGCSFIAGDLMESDIYLLKFLMKNTK